MAKYKASERALNKLFKNYNASLKKAMEYASNIAIKDIYQYSMTCLEEYYANYDPSSYNRTETLQHAFIPHLHYNKSKEQLESVVGVYYDASVLDVYAQGIYEGSAKYGQPDGSWILDNYLRGVHPATNGSSNPLEVLYFEITDPISPTQKMQKYLDDYKETFYTNLLIGFAKQIY